MQQILFLQMATGKTRLQYSLCGHENLNLSSCLSLLSTVRRDVAWPMRKNDQNHKNKIYKPYSPNICVEQCLHHKNKFHKITDHAR